MGGEEGGTIEGGQIEGGQIGFHAGPVGGPPYGVPTEDCLWRGRTGASSPVGEAARPFRCGGLSGGQ